MSSSLESVTPSPGGVSDVRSPRRETIDNKPELPDPPNGRLAASGRGGCGLPRTSDQSETPELGRCRFQTVHFTAELAESDGLYLHIWTLVSELTLAREG